MNKPLIGLTVDCHYNEADERTKGSLCLNWNYAQAVAEAGGIPIILPPTADAEQVALLIDGWLIPGGADMDACNFGQENHPSVELQDPTRFAYEKALFELIPPQVPVLGICYGCQFLNVIRGGSLFQHLPDRANTDTHTGGVLQSYEVAPGSKLAAILMGSITEGKSYHHQAVDRLGRGMSVSARSRDGVVEALEATDRDWMIGVQWHPERTLDDRNSRTLFNNFVFTAAEYALAKTAQE